MGKKLANRIKFNGASHFVFLSIFVSFTIVSNLFIVVKNI